MKTTWTQGLDKDQVKDIRGEFLSSTILRKRLIEILEMKIDSTRTSARNESNYSEPAWPYKQAGFLEREKAFLEIISLLEN